MARSTTVLATALALFSCKGTAVVDVDVPEETAWVAVVTVDESGEVLEATPLLPWHATDPLPLITRSTGTTLLLGFSAAQLETLGAEVDDSPLVPVKGCRQGLPAPLWTRRWFDGALRSHDGPTPPLTAPWLTSLCPDLSGSAVRVDADCFETRCEPRVRWTGRCALELDLGSCGLGVVPASVDASGAVCADFSAAGWACEPVADPVAQAAYACLEPAPCEIHVHAGEPPTAPFELAKTQLVEDAEPYLPGTLDRLGVLQTDTLADGYLLELLVLPDAVVVSRSVDLPVGACFPGDARPGALVFLDPESLLPVRTTTAPRCLRRMVPDEAGGFVGAYVDGNELLLGRFDERGSLTSSVPMDPRQEAGPGEPRLVRAGVDRVLEMLEIGSRLVVLLGNSTGDSFLFTFDAVTLGPLLRAQIRSATSAMLSTGDTVVATARNLEQEIAWLDVTTANEVAVERLPWRDLPRETDSLLSLHAVRGELLVTGTPPPALFLLSPMGPVRARAMIFDRDAFVVTMASWPGRSVFVSALAQEEGGRWSSLGALFDPARGRFLPGTWPLGDGVVGRIRSDDRGRLWLLLPWSGEVIRLTPR